MKKLSFLLGLLSLCYGTLKAQKLYDVKGAAFDAVSNTKLANASISILNAKDSTLYKFTRAAANGSFSLSNLNKGKYIILMTYPKYADYVDHFTIDSTKTEIDFGLIDMKLKARLLADVIIKGQVAAIKIKGDTTEFNAAAFKIAANDRVEDLIKQFPGIQVDKDGKITAQGQTIQKVLVDGEEFFGDDPTLVTKNLRADMVDKVQLYDKKSDQASFTGVDDGEKTKTLNIKLKEDKKNGYFGKLSGGSGNDNFNESQAMINAFKGKMKVSAYGTMSNTGKTGLGWSDNDKYGSSNNMEMSDDGSMMYFYSGSDDFESYDGQYNGQGIPLAKTGGAHFNNKWNSDKESINLNYKIGDINIKTNRNNLSKNTFPSSALNPTGEINNNSDLISDNSMFRQKMDATYEIKLDTTSTLKIMVDGTLKNSDTKNSYIASSLNGNDALLNSSTRNLTNNEKQQLFNASALWTKKLKKKGRTLSLNIGQSVTKINTDGYLNSDYKFYRPSGVKDSVVNQYKVNDTENLAFKSNLTYTEPFTKTLSLVLNYGLSINNGISNRQSFNQSANGNYDAFDPLFSNDFKLDQLTNQYGAVMSYKKAKTAVTFGTKLSDVNFKQIDAYTNKSITRNFLNWTPQARYQYKFSQYRGLSVGYNGNTTQPSINQVQPLRENTDPLNISIGNPDLKPSYTNRFNANYNSYKVLSNQYINFYGSYSFTNNPIVSDVTTDAVGKSIYKAINLKNNNTGNFYIGSYMSTKLKKLDLDLGLDFSVNGTTYFNLINSELNKTQSNSYMGRLSVSRYKDKKYSFRISFGPNYSASQASMQKNMNNNGWGLNGDASFSMNLPGKIELSSDARLEYKQKTQTFNTDFNRVIWNSSVSKKFFKAESLILKLSGNDLLNQNVGFNRYANSNGFTENNYTTIKRYFMGSLIWDFNKMGGKSTLKK